MDDGRMLTVRQTALSIGLTESRIQKALRESRLCGVRQGGTWRVLVDDQDRVLYRGDRLPTEWRHDAVRHVGTRSDPWPTDITARLDTLQGRTILLTDSATARERELATMVEELRRDREFDRIASQTKADEATEEITRLKAHLEEERRRRELGVRSALLGLVAMIPAADAEELRRFGLPAE